MVHESERRMIIDPRVTQTPPEQIPDAAWMPIATAHILVGCGKSSVYRWYTEDRLEGRELVINGHGGILHVRAGDVRELFKRMRSHRHSRKLSRTH